MLFHNYQDHITNADELPMKFSLLSVCVKNPDGTVDGYWIQDYIGTLEEARDRAKRASEINSDKEIEVVEQVRCPNPRLNYWSNRRIAV